MRYSFVTVRSHLLLIVLLVSVLIDCIYGLLVLVLLIGGKPLYRSLIATILLHA
jgi:hypothetical protein